MTDVRRLESAATNWNDLVGTAAADRRGKNDHGAYEVMGLDPEHCCIVAVDLSLTDHRPRITVYVADAPADAGAEPEPLVDEDGDIAVTAVSVVDPQQISAFMAHSFQSLEVRLTPRSLRNETLIVRDESTAHGTVAGRTAVDGVPAACL